MIKLSDYAKLIRSKNAGPFMLTIDIMFENRDKYIQVVQSQKINCDGISKLFNTDTGKIIVENYEPANSIKVTLPRPYTSGSFQDSDVFGGQQYGPLVDMIVS